MWPVGQLRRTYNRNGNIVIIPQFFRITEEQKKPMAERPKTYSIWSCECLFITDLTSWWWFSVRSTRGCQANSSPRAAWGWPRPVWPPPRPPAPPEHNGWLSWSAVRVAIPNLRYKVAVLRQEVILYVLESHVSRCTRVLARPVTRGRHVATRGLVLEPQLRPGLAEPRQMSGCLLLNILRGHLRLHPAAWYRQWTRPRVPLAAPVCCNI